MVKGTKFIFAPKLLQFKQNKYHTKDGERFNKA